MPPKKASTNATGRKGPQFKPPRPANATAPASAPAERAQSGAAQKSTANAAPRPAAHVVLSDDDEVDHDPFQQGDDDVMEDAPSPARTARPHPTETAPSPIPAPLLARLLYENFEDPNTQIQKGAMKLVEKYMEIFVREALARAKLKREQSAQAGGLSDGFLQVEDLEKLAPQLVLDF
ncbi:hypothetical protein ACEQ8H_005970 [Pleosporales sp. CAS-2024a]